MSILKKGLEGFGLGAFIGALAVGCGLPMMAVGGKDSREVYNPAARTYVTEHSPGQMLHWVAGMWPWIIGAGVALGLVVGVWFAIGESRDAKASPRA